LSFITGFINNKNIIPSQPPGKFNSYKESEEKMDEEVRH